MPLTGTAGTPTRVARASGRFMEGQRMGVADWAVFLGYLWGRSLIGTRGLGWAVLVHMLADLTFFSVSHVAW